MDERHLTFIIVPHGELETRTFQVSYRKLKVLLGVAVALVLLVCVFLALWFPALTQAARVPGLERDLAELERERARVAELAKTLADVESQYERVRQMLGADAPVAGEAPLLPPLGQVPAAVDSGPAEQVQLDNNLTDWPLAGRGFVTRRMEPGVHAGVDIAAPPSTEVRAAGDGLVVASGEDGAYGRYVVLDHGAGLVTVYSQAERTYVKQGEKVRAGQVIALSGSSGRATAPHLHFEVRRNGRPADPLQFIRQP
jgi:murein DD-endopeptidase MepM/ murein hydrolase activator NlpD